MTNKLLWVGLALGISGTVAAQQSLVGTYNGHYLQPVSRGEVRQSLKLQIASVEGEVVRGKATLVAQEGPSACNGDYNLAGTVKGNDVHLRSTEKGGRAGDCSLNLRLASEGNKLVGTMGNLKIELSK